MTAQRIRYLPGYPTSIWRIVSAPCHGGWSLELDILINHDCPCYGDYTTVIVRHCLRGGI